MVIIYLQPLKDDEVEAFYDVVKGLNVGVFSNGYYKIYNEEIYKIEVFFQPEV